MAVETLNIYIRPLVYDREFAVNDYIKYDLNKNLGEIDRLPLTLRE
jgi:hypothetical protein